MTLTVIAGNRDNLERQLVEELFRPTAAPDCVEVLLEKLEPRGFGDHIRLTRREIKQLAGLTGSDPKYIRTRTQLESFVGAHLVNYPGRSLEEMFLRRMLESFLPKSLEGA